MELIASILPQDKVFTQLELSSKKRVFEHVGQLLEPVLQLGHSKIFESLIAREKLGSTGLGHGVAIPHGRIKGLKETVGVFLQLKSPIAFDAPDNQPVSLIFILLVPEQATDLHLQILGELAQMFSDRNLRDSLNVTATPAEAHRLLTEWTPRATN